LGLQFIQFLSKLLVDGFLLSQLLVFELTSLILMIFDMAAWSIIVLIFLIFEIRLKMMNLTEFVYLIIVLFSGELESFIDICQFPILVFIKPQPPNKLPNLLILGFD